MKRSIIKTCAWTIGILVGAVCLGTLLMILVYLLPVDRMRENAKEALALQFTEGDSFQWIERDYTSKSDGYTDNLMINTATYIGEGSVVENALLNPRASYKEGSQIQILSNSLFGTDEKDYGATYGRYWHGYLVFLKPLLMLANYNTIRWLNTIVGCFLVAVILLGFYRRFNNYKYALAFTGAVLFLNPVVMRVSLQFNTVFYVIMLEYIAALYWGDRLEKRDGFSIYF